MARQRPRKSIRSEVKDKAHGCCEYCWSQVAFSPDPFAIEHIEPLVHGGSNELENLAYACHGCNGKKYDRVSGYDAVTGRDVLLYHPRRDKWDDHFVWQDNYTQIIGITPTGRATVKLLDLNREGVVNLRIAVRSIGKHPPI